MPRQWCLFLRAPRFHCQDRPCCKSIMKQVIGLNADKDGSTEKKDILFNQDWKKECNSLLIVTWNTSFTKSQKEVGKILPVRVSVGIVTEHCQSHVICKSKNSKVPVKRRCIHKCIKDKRYGHVTQRRLTEGYLESRWRTTWFFLQMATDFW